MVGLFQYLERPQGFINITPTCSIEYKSGSKRFALSTGDIIFFLEADSTSEANAWVSVLLSSINAAQLDGDFK